MLFTKDDRALMQLIDAKLDAIQAHLKGCSLLGLSQRTESGLNRLLQSHAGLSSEEKIRHEELLLLICKQWQSHTKKLDCLQGKELLSQFKANDHQPKRRKR